MDLLQQRINSALVEKMPRSIRRKARRVAVDITLIPYHGQHHQNQKEIYRSKAKSGATHFHAYATLVVTYVCAGDPLTEMKREFA